MQAISASGRVARAGDVACACCRRTPLVGERAILHAVDGRESWVCELCEHSARNVARLGEVRYRVRVRPQLAGAEHHHAAWA